MTKTENQRPKTNEVAALVLAAGRSQRMGAFKPLLPFGPKTVIETCIDNLRGGGIETIVVVLGNGPQGNGLKVYLQNSRVIVAINPDSQSEMSASIACAIQQLPTATKAVMINPVDHAAVPAEIIGALINEWKQGAVLVKPTHNERGGHPVVVDLAFRDELLSLDSNGGLRTFFGIHEDQLKRLPVHSNLIACDMDTWDDYAALHEEIFGVPPPARTPPKGSV